MFPLNAVWHQVFIEMKWNSTFLGLWLNNIEYLQRKCILLAHDCVVLRASEISRAFSLPRDKFAVICSHAISF